MTLIPMPRTQIFEFIDICFLNEKYTIQITLIDGKTFLGTIPSQVTIFKLETNEKVTPSSKECCFFKDCLILEYNKPFNEHSIYIPIDIIAGINVFDYQEQKNKFEFEPKTISPALNRSIYDYMFEDLLSYASKVDWKIIPHFCEYSLRAVTPFTWGDLTYKSDTALYADWNYLQNISGGLTSLGAGIGIFSLSSGWTESLWSQFKKKVQQKSIDIDKITTENEIVVQGYIIFIKHYSDLSILEGSYDTIEMEGAEWIPALICNKRIANITDIKNCKWSLVYLKEDCLMFPIKAWERISNSISLYCEVVHVSISTEFGHTPFYLKARCAAYIKNN